MAQTPEEKPRTYAWARKISPRQAQWLSPGAKRGLKYALALADNAERRKKRAFKQRKPEKLTLELLAKRRNTSAEAVDACISFARWELFGKDLSDSGIYYRLRRERRLAIMGERFCADFRCKRLLPPEATVRRRYCDFHVQSHARVARHRKHKDA